MKKVRCLLAIFLLIAVCSPSFANSMLLHGQWRKGSKSISMDIPIKADIDETSKVLSLVFLQYVGDVFVSIADTNGKIVYEEMVDTQNVSSCIILLDGAASGVYQLSISESDNYAKGFFNL